MNPEFLIPLAILSNVLPVVIIIVLLWNIYKNTKK